MKKITFILSLVSISLTVISANAAVQNDNDIVTLPEYRVSTPRYTAGEKSIQENLADFREQARPAVRVATELPALGTTVGKTPAPRHGEFATKLVPLRHARS